MKMLQCWHALIEGVYNQIGTAQQSISGMRGAMPTFDDLYSALDEMSVSHLYHFTAVSNIPSIRKHRGLYSRSAHLGLKIACTYCSNDWSRNLDDQRGLDHYIHLSLHRSHAMAKEAHSRLERDGDHLGIVRIDRSILEVEGTIYCGNISNMTNLPKYPVAECADRIRRLAPGTLKRAEILIPVRVPFRYFVDSWRWNGE
jgi:hypothetical protein